MSQSIKEFTVIQLYRIFTSFHFSTDFVIFPKMVYFKWTLTLSCLQPNALSSSSNLRALLILSSFFCHHQSPNHTRIYLCSSLCWLVSCHSHLSLPCIVTLLLLISLQCHDSLLSSLTSIIQIIPQGSFLPYSVKTSQFIHHSRCATSSPIPSPCRIHPSSWCPQPSDIVMETHETKWDKCAEFRMTHNA